MIFVGICSYRDSELIPTIRDCISKAKWPNDLRFAVCLQHDGSYADVMEWNGDDRFKVFPMKWEEAQGLGFARSIVQNLYGGEEFSLEIDSHHRFTQNWDETLIHMLELTGDPKPVIGTYANVYQPENPDYKVSLDPLKMVADEFTPSGTIKFKPAYIPHWQDLTKPIPARFCSGHFFFCPGAWHNDFRFDPEIFFGGEEISLAIRSFTMGWSLFHPHRAVLFHEYLRTHRSKIWTDHNQSSGLIPWHERDAISKKRIRKLLQEEDNDADIGPYGLGTVRTHREYELHAGINFSKRMLHPDARTGENPPTGKDGSEVDPDQDSTYYGLEDAKGNVLYKGFQPPGSPPLKAIKWERSKSHGWGKRTDVML